jgi:hypothetical protein
MKTTIDLPDDLVKTLKLRAIHEDRTLKDLITEMLKNAVGRDGQATTTQRARFPLLPESKLAQPGRNLTPERVHELLTEDEVSHALR